MVVEEIECDVNVVPVPREAPPVEAAYQLMVPAEAVAPSVTVPVLQRLAGVVEAIKPGFPIVAEVLLEYCGQ